MRNCFLLRILPVSMVYAPRWTLPNVLDGKTPLLSTRHIHFSAFPLFHLHQLTLDTVSRLHINVIARNSENSVEKLISFITITDWFVSNYQIVWLSGIGILRAVIVLVTTRCHSFYIFAPLLRRC